MIIWSYKCQIYFFWIFLQTDNTIFLKFSFSTWAEIIVSFKLWYFTVYFFIIVTKSNKECIRIQILDTRERYFLLFLMRKVWAHPLMHILIKIGEIFKTDFFWENHRKFSHFFVFTGWHRIWFKTALFNKIIRADCIFLVQNFGFPMLRPLDFDQNRNFWPILCSYSP